MLHLDHVKVLTRLHPSHSHLQSYTAPSLGLVERVDGSRAIGLSTPDASSREYYKESCECFIWQICI